MFRQHPSSLFEGPSGLFQNCFKSSLHCRMEQICLDQQFRASASMITEQRLTTRQNWSADRKSRHPGSAETSTQSTRRYRGALWCILFATSCRILNLIYCTARSQCRLSLINADTGANFGIRSMRRAAAFKILWTRLVCTAVMPDRTELQ